LSTSFLRKARRRPLADSLEHRAHLPWVREAWTLAESRR